MKEISLNNNNIQINNLNINLYINNIYKFPMINSQDEYKIATHFKKTLDIKAANILIITHLRFVVRIAKYYIEYGLLLNDLIQEGSIGLIKSIKKFDPKKNIRLVTFSIHWIKSEIHNYILKNWKIVKIITTRTQRKLFFNFKKKTNKNHNLFINNEKDKLLKKTDTKLIDINNLYKEKDLDIINLYYKNTKDLSYFFINRNYKKNLNNKLRKSLMLLDKRSREILYKRYLSKSFINYTLSNLSMIFNISKERIRQIEKTAILKLRLLIK